ncbi:unnamed protein product [Alopecurus aequalis]
MDLRHNHCRDNGEDAMDKGRLSPLRTGTRRQHDEEVGQRRSDIKEVDFFSASGDTGTRSPKVDGGGCRVMHGCHDDDVHTRLDLMTTTIAVGGAAPAPLGEGRMGQMVGTKKNHKVSPLIEELRRVFEENLRLRGMLEELTRSYGALYHQLLQLTRQQGHPHRHPDLLMNNQLPPTLTSTMQPHLTATGALNTSSTQQFLEPRAGSTPQQGDEVVAADSPSTFSSGGKRRTPQDEAAAPGTWDRSNEQASSEQMPCRKPRVSVRARSEAPMISDGCQWRKYGQKMAKGNPCPRAYYRCTMAIGCPVRKQVQRWAEDKTVLITTYEGNHSHQLPPAATTMANTTSAAATMLLSGPVASRDGAALFGHPAVFHHHQSSFPYASTVATLSASAPFPTITLDLTQAPAGASGMPHRLSSVQQQPTAMPFAATPQVAMYPQLRASTVLPARLGLGLGARQQSVMETVTAAIAADPNFSTALAAAISSVMAGEAHRKDNPPIPRGSTVGEAHGDGAAGVDTAAHTDGSHVAPSGGSPRLATQSCTTATT